MKIVLENVSKRYQNNNFRNKSDILAVNNISVEIKDGSLVALLGPSGCGKSTMLNMISGLEMPTNGKIYFNDEDITFTEPEKRGIGFVFQNYALYPHLTVKNNILFPLQNLKGKDKLSKEEMNARMEKVVKLVSLEKYLDRRPGKLSGGQQQRVAIARALVKTPKVLLLDEPLSNLDARLRLQTREEIRRIQRETGITTLFVTHDQEEAMSISDEIIVMKDGTLQQSGKPQDVYDNPCNLFVAEFLGNPHINVFKGHIKDGKLFIGSQEISSCMGIDDRDVFVGIRPEGFEVCENGKFVCDFERIETMGRDVCIIAGNSELVSSNFRIIIGSDTEIDTSEKTISLSIKPNKMFVFDSLTKERIKGE